MRHSFHRACISAAGSKGTASSAGARRAGMRCFLAACCAFLSTEAVRESLTYALELQDVLSEEAHEVHSAEAPRAAPPASRGEIGEGRSAPQSAATYATGKAGTGSRLLALGPPHVEIMGFVSALAARLQRSLHIDERSANACDQASLVGCNQGCECVWFQQCFPKFVPGSGGEDAGICAASLPVLVLMSLVLILAIFAFVVVLRLVLQHQQYLRERADHEALMAKRMAAKSKGKPTESCAKVTIAGTPRQSTSARFDRGGRPKEDWESGSEDEEQHT